MAMHANLVVSLVLVLTISLWEIHSKHVKHEAHGSFSSNQTLVETEGEKRIGVMAAIGGFETIMGFAERIQGYACKAKPDLPICEPDEKLQMLKKLEKKFEEMHKDIKDIKEIVSDIWEHTYYKWYFDHLNVNKVYRGRVLNYIKNGVDDPRSRAVQKLFISEVLGTEGKDQYVEKALLHIRLLVTDRLISQMMKRKKDSGANTIDAAKATWRLIRKVFRYQEDGYASVLIAASLKYKLDDSLSEEENKENEKAFKTIMSEVCTWWPTKDSAERCASYEKVDGLEDRRKVQQDHLLSTSQFRELALVPALRFHQDCSTFKKAEGVIFLEGFLYVAQPEARNVLIAKPDDMQVVKTLTFGDNKPFSVAIEKRKKLLAVAIKQSSGNPKIKMYKINGDLGKPEGLSLQFAYDVSENIFFSVITDKGRKDAKVSSISFCGGRFGYSDFNGVLRHFRLEDEGPSLWGRSTWYTGFSKYGFNRGNMNFASCANTGREWLVQKTSDSNLDPKDGVGAIQTYITQRTIYDILDNADAVVRREDWFDINDRKARNHFLKGMAMDSKRRYVYTSEQWNLGNSVGGIYKRAIDGVHHFVREWQHFLYANRVHIFGVAVDENGFAYVIEQAGSSPNRCLAKYAHSPELENVLDESIQ